MAWTANDTIAAATSAQAAILGVAGWFAYRQLRAGRNTLDAQVLQWFYERYRAAWLDQTRQDLMDSSKLVSLQKDNDRQLRAFVGWWEFMAIMVGEGLLDFELFDRMFYSAPLNIWTAIQPYAEFRRQAPNGEAFAKYLELVAKRQMKRRQSTTRRGPRVCLSAWWSRPGTAITVSGSGFRANESLTIHCLYPNVTKPVDAVVRVDAAGALSTSVDIPRACKAGLVRLDIIRKGRLGSFPRRRDHLSRVVLVSADAGGNEDAKTS